MVRAYLGLGANLGDRVTALRAAIGYLGAHGAVLAVSRLYESEPWEEPPGRNAGERRWHLNCAVALETALAPRDLLAQLQAVERALGRTRSDGTPEAQRFADRTVDIDILLYGDHVVSVPEELHVPHLLMAERRFVLLPLAEIAPTVTHPTDYRTVRELLAELEDEHDVRPGDYPADWYR